MSPEGSRGFKHGREAALSDLGRGRYFAERNYASLVADLRRNHKPDDFDKEYVHGYRLVMEGM